MLELYFILAIAPLVGLVIQVGVYLLLSFVFPRRSPWWRVFIGLCFALMVNIAAVVMISVLQRLPTPDLLGFIMVNTGAMLSLGFGFFTFVNLHYTSLRITMLRKLGQHGGALELSQIMQEYSPEVVLASRLARLTKAGELIFDGAYYRVGSQSRFSRIGAILHWFKRVLLVHKQNSVMS